MWLRVAMAVSMIGATGSASALDYAEYGARDDRITIYLQGAYHGMLFSNAEQVRLGRPPLFCIHGTLNILELQLYSVVDGYLKRHPDHVSFPVEAMLLKGLEEEYPC